MPCQEGASLAATKIGALSSTGGDDSIAELLRGSIGIRQAPLCCLRLFSVRPTGDWHQQKAIADRHLRVYVRNVDYNTVQLREGVRMFVAEAYDPAFAPPAEVDPALQGAALNAKPPKPPRQAIRAVPSNQVEVDNDCS
jgi:hypothetical protein